MANFVCFIAYFIIKIKVPGYNIPHEKFDVPISKEAYALYEAKRLQEDYDLLEEEPFKFHIRIMTMPILNTVLIFLAFIKLMFYLRLFEDFGNMVTLAGTCI